MSFEKNSPLWHTVEIHRNEETKKAHFDHLIVCDRVWGCPVCASRISESRRQALSTATSRSDYQTVLVTFTLSHHLGDKLVDLRDAILGAYRRLKSGRFWQDLKHGFDWVGDVRSLEVTHGDNGWHPHIHALMMFENELSIDDLKELENRLKRRWLVVLDKLGMFADWEHGCDIKTGDRYIREYIAKFGKLPEVEKRKSWTVEHEIAKSHVKKGKAKGRTPFELLADYGNGDKKAGALFVEYYFCFKGRHQLQWSRGLRALLNMDEIEAEIEEKTIGDNDQMIAEIYPSDWRKVLYNYARGEVLRIAGEGDTVALWNFIDDLPEPVITLDDL